MRTYCMLVNENISTKANGKEERMRVAGDAVFEQGDILPAVLARQGWKAAEDAEQAKIYMLGVRLTNQELCTIVLKTKNEYLKRGKTLESQASGVILPHIWSSHFPELSNKATLHKTLSSYCSRNQIASFFPETTVFSFKELHGRELQAEHPSVPNLVPCDHGYYVKHPNSAGGSGVVYATSQEDVLTILRSLEARTPCAVVQHAIPPSLLLPRGPSKFDLRVWAVYSNHGAFYIPKVRAKTASINTQSQEALTNKRLQQVVDKEFGTHYPFNNATHEQVAALFPEGDFDKFTATAIADALWHCYCAYRPQIQANASQVALATNSEASTLFYLCGCDFIVDKEGKPWLLEFNIKPFHRYLSSDQFIDPMARTFAQEAIEDLIRLINSRRLQSAEQQVGDLSYQREDNKWQRLPVHK